MTRGYLVMLGYWRDGAALEAEDIKEICRDRIAHFKIPRYVKFTDEFPFTITGKLQKYLMREQSIGDLGLGETAQERHA